MVNEIVREVHACLDSGCCIAGLSLALILPDICGKVYYPELGNKQRYIKWFDEFIGKYEKDKESERIWLPYLSGNLVYSLRCSMLHQGNPSVENNKLDLVYFELIYRRPEDTQDCCGSAQAEMVKDEKGNDIAINKKLRINVRDLCWKICRLAEVCYDREREKFNFFEYNLVDTAHHAIYT